MKKILEIFNQTRRYWRLLARKLRNILPKKLFARALLIVIVPIILLQSVIAFVFMERHWETVTLRLSRAVTQDIAALVTILENYPQDKNYKKLRRLASDQLNLSISIEESQPLPKQEQPFLFSFLHTTLSQMIETKIKRPYWIDTTKRSNLIEIKIALDDKILTIIARRSQAYAANSHIFLVWMASTSLILMLIAILFLRNQIRPIQKLVDAAELFGKGQPIAQDFKPQGALEIRKAAQAFLSMKRRIERHVEQRTTMLAGISHDLRTILTRFRLELAMMETSDETIEMRHDIDEMQKMLEGYLAFAKGGSGEKATKHNILESLQAIQNETKRMGHDIHLEFNGTPLISLKPLAFKRCIHNLVQNAIRYGQIIHMKGHHEDHLLTLTIEDDGIGIDPAHYEDVFRPFMRLDKARNQDDGNIGLGLSITRDIIYAHGGDIHLSQSHLGGLCVTLTIPT